MNKKTSNYIMLLYNSVVFFLFTLFNQNMSSTLCHIFILLFSLSIIWALTFLFNLKILLSGKTFSNKIN